MSPRPIGQLMAAVSLLTATISVALVGDPGATVLFAIAGAGALVSGALALRYRLQRPDEVSAERRSLDRVMVLCLVAGLCVPAGLGLWELLLGGPVAADDAKLSSMPAQVAVAAGLGLTTAMLASTCIDWWFIRPFRDGVLNDPVCQMGAADDAIALFYARAWIAHRVVADLLGWGGLAVILIVGLVGLQLSTDDPVISNVLTYAGPAGAIYVVVGRFLLGRLRSVPAYMQSPSPGLGRWVLGSGPCGENIEGFLVDVSTERGLQIRPSPDAAKSTFVDLADAPELGSATRPLCQTQCEHWIPGCERGRLEAEAMTRNAGQE